MTVIMGNYFEGEYTRYYTSIHYVSALFLYDDASFVNSPCSASAHFEDPPGVQGEAERVDA